MKIRQFEIWLADLNHGSGAETGKKRPVAIIQSDLLNKHHLSTIVCPITTKVKLEAEILRVHLNKGNTILKTDLDIMIDQVRIIDNRQLIKRIGELSLEQIELMKANLAIVFDI